VTTTQLEAAKVCRQRLIDKIGADRYELWFQYADSISTRGTQLIVSADSDFEMRCLRNTFGKEISAVARKQLGIDAQVLFCVNPKVANNQGNAGVSSDARSSDDQNISTHKRASRERSVKATSMIPLDEPSLTLATQSVEPAKRVKTGKKTTSKKCSRIQPLAVEENCYNQPSTGESTVQPSGIEQPQADQSSDVPLRQQAINFDQPANVDSVVYAAESRRTKQRPVVAAGGEQGLKRRWASLETFVIDDRNRVAATSAAEVARNIGQVTPLFISGPTGSGKTHLLEGVYQTSRSKLRPGRVMYMSAAQYTTQFLESLHERRMPMFRQKFQELDVFLLDDLQFFQGKKATVVELVQMIDNMVRRGKQLVLSADRTLAELNFLGTELITRISSGLVCRVDYPSQQGRSHIVYNSARERQLKLDPHVVDLIAERIAGDLRHIRGAINRLHAYHLATGEPITVENARDWLADVFQTASKIPSMQEIEGVVCQMFGLDERRLRSDDKARATSQPRMLAMWLARKYTRAALTEIGEYFGGRSHSTVLSAKNKVSLWLRNGQRVQTSSGEVSVEDAVRRIETKLHVG
jgi:chromosomal replication initiator protein